MYSVRVYSNDCPRRRRLESCSVEGAEGLAECMRRHRHPGDLPARVNAEPVEADSVMASLRCGRGLPPGDTTATPLELGYICRGPHFWAAEFYVSVVIDRFERYRNEAWSSVDYDDIEHHDLFRAVVGGEPQGPVRRTRHGIWRDAEPAP